LPDSEPLFEEQPIEITAYNRETPARFMSFMPYGSFWSGSGFAGKSDSATTSSGHYKRKST
jgi:hypothetical protein